MKQTFKVSVWQEEDMYVAQCLDVDVASQGETREEALENLREALQLYFTPPVVTPIPEITSIEVELHAA
jgi:predicted RNase H-like HicB family nuclease